MGKIGISKYLLVYVCAPVNVINGIGKEEIGKFWNDMNKCFRSFERGSRMVLIGDINVSVGSNDTAGLVR